MSIVTSQLFQAFSILRRLSKLMYHFFLIFTCRCMKKHNFDKYSVWINKCDDFKKNFTSSRIQIICICVLNGMPNGRYALPTVVYIGLAGVQYKYSTIPASIQYTQLYESILAGQCNKH